MAWTCSVCGEEHRELLRDIRSGLPEPVFAVDSGERDGRVDMSDDWCRFVDEDGVMHYYVRGVLHLPIDDTDDDFRFGVWVEVAEDDFYAIGRLWDEADAVARPFFGQLANDVLLYPDAIGLPVALQLRDVLKLPAIIMLDADNALVTAQRKRISVDRATRIAEAQLH